MEWITVVVAVVVVLVAVAMAAGPARRGPFGRERKESPVVLVVALVVGLAIGLGLMWLARTGLDLLFGG